MHVVSWCIRQTTGVAQRLYRRGFPGDFWNRFGMEIITADLNDYLRNLSAPSLYTSFLPCFTAIFEGSSRTMLRLCYRTRVHSSSITTFLLLYLLGVCKVLVFFASFYFILVSYRTRTVNHEIRIPSVVWFFEKGVTSNFHWKYNIIEC